MAEVNGTEMEQTDLAAANTEVSLGSATVLGGIAGLLYGGAKELAASASKDAEVVLKLGSTPDKREQYRIVRDAMEKKYIRVARGSIIGGATLGSFTGCFIGLQHYLEERRGTKDAFNIAGAGSATAAAFGLLLPGSIRWRARNMLVGSALGVIIGLPLGWIQVRLVQRAQDKAASLSPNSEEKEQPDKDRVADAIERLEKVFNKENS
eukprot:TRINITY_DN3067_c0_g1_i2.p1 TRINITY_DN3067_c0_g1~~TRINITY_DN3067_c0_g1_i2.p1  ORF type:complete len:208 (+),score=57.77 TRINITY_DN3067_c0_g1_i2:209-832(+)